MKLITIMIICSISLIGCNIMDVENQTLNETQTITIIDTVYQMETIIDTILIEDTIYQHNIPIFFGAQNGILCDEFDIDKKYKSDIITDATYVEDIYDYLIKTCGLTATKWTNGETKIELVQLFLTDTLSLETDILNEIYEDVENTNSSFRIYVESDTVKYIIVDGYYDNHGVL